MKATFNNIADQLVKVLTDKAESAQYYSDNEQYTGICGWCGIMSPESRPAYIKTFGKDTTEAAEAKAREMIAEKEAARQYDCNGKTVVTILLDKGIMSDGKLYKAIQYGAPRGYLLKYMPVGRL